MSDTTLPKDVPAADDVTQLTVEANRARARLLRTVDALDRKRHDVTNVPLQIRKHAEPLAAGAGVMLLVFGGVIAFAVHRITTRAERRRRERYSLLKRLWMHPERAAKESHPGFFAQLARNVLLGLVGTAVMIPAKRLLAKAEEGALDKVDPARAP